MLVACINMEREQKYALWFNLVVGGLSSRDLQTYRWSISVSGRYEHFPFMHVAHLPHQIIQTLCIKAGGR